MMNSFGLKYHHLGLATKNEKKAADFLSGLEYSIGKKIFDPLQNVNLIMCKHEVFPNIELIFPKSVDDLNGPLSNIFKFQNELIYHTCYSTSNQDMSLRKIKESGLRAIPISSKKKAILFNNSLVSFYKIIGFGIIEILELEEN